MLIDLDAGDGREIDHVAGMGHSHGQVRRFLFIHAAQEDGHAPGRRLIVGDGAGGVFADEAVDFFSRKSQAVPLMFDAVHRPHGITPLLFQVT